MLRSSGLGTILASPPRSLTFLPFYTPKAIKFHSFIYLAVLTFTALCLSLSRFAYRIIILRYRQQSKIHLVSTSTFSVVENCFTSYFILSKFLVSLTELFEIMMGFSVQGMLDLMIAGVSLLIGLGIFGFTASILCFVAFLLNAKDAS